MRKLGFIGAAMGLMSRFIDKIVPKAPDLSRDNLPMNRAARRRARYGNRIYNTQVGYVHIAGEPHAKLLKQFSRGTATQRHPG